MRVMEIPRFPRRFEINDLSDLFRRRLGQAVVLWPSQAIALLGYMCCPTNAVARADLQRTLRTWSDEFTTSAHEIPRRIGRIQNDWNRVADIFHHYVDLVEGQHQKHRGGASIGKAITLVDANAKSRGTGAANLWDVWAKYKDVAHLVTTAALVCGEVRTRASDEPFGPFGISVEQFTHLHLTMMMPDLVLSVAQSFERYGLIGVQGDGAESTLNPDTLWRIPADINVEPIEPPARIIRKQDIAILNARRAGNRGKANRKTTPVSA